MQSWHVASSCNPIGQPHVFYSFLSHHFVSPSSILTNTSPSFLSPLSSRTTKTQPQILPPKPPIHTYSTSPSSIIKTKMSSNITDQSAAAQDNEIIDKGKGKAIQQPEETEAETSEDEEMDEDAEEDELAEIDSSNIIQNGRRTRGKQIDFVAAAAKEQPAGDDDEEDDEDFVAPEEADDKDIEMH